MKWLSTQRKLKIFCQLQSGVHLTSGTEWSETASRLLQGNVSFAARRFFCMSDCCCYCCRYFVYLAPKLPHVEAAASINHFPSASTASVVMILPAVQRSSNIKPKKRGYAWCDVSSRTCQLLFAMKMLLFKGRKEPQCSQQCNRKKRCLPPAMQMVNFGVGRGRKGQGAGFNLPVWRENIVKYLHKRGHTSAENKLQNDMWLWGMSLSIKTNSKHGSPRQQKLISHFTH